MVNTAWYHFNGESKKKSQIHRNSIEKWFPGAGGGSGRNRERLVIGFKLSATR